MRKAVYAGSFDPVTLGHLWMIEQAVALFPRVIVAVGVNSNKKSTFTLPERIEMIKDAVWGPEMENPKNSKVDIVSFEDQYLVDYAKSVNATHIIRGLRSASDFEFEKIMRHVNADLCPELSTVFLMPPRDLVEVSSSFVKGLVGPKGWENVVRRYLPMMCADRFIEKFNNG